jgi:hypothetical protein
MTSFLRRKYFYFYKNNQNQCFLVILLLFFIFCFISLLLDLFTGLLVISLFSLTGFLIYSLENRLKEFFTFKLFILLSSCWFFFLVYNKSFLVLFVYGLSAFFLYCGHSIQKLYLEAYSKLNVSIKFLTVVETVFLDFRTIENHLRDDFPVLLLLRKTHVLTFLIHLLLFSFVPSFYEYTVVLYIGVGFLLLWWVDMMFFFFVRYQIVSFCNVNV